MKRFTLNLLLMVLCFPLLAQNAQFIPFGLSREEVLAFLQSRDYIIRIDTEKTDELCAIGKCYFLEYKFRDDKLYEISTNKYYPKNKFARLKVQNALDYFNRCKGDIFKANETEKGEQHWLSVHEDRLMELQFISYGDFMKVKLLSTSRNYGPRQNTEERIVALTYNN